MSICTVVAAAVITSSTANVTVGGPGAAGCASVALERSA
jgi:hypothetical protein